MPSNRSGVCPRCGISTFALREGQAQPCRDCRSVDPKFTSQWPTIRQRKEDLRAKK